MGFPRRISRAVRKLCTHFALLGLGLSMVFSSPGWAATFRITLKDGNRVEVPFCWEKGATLFFEIPGGVAGIPRSEVARIEEVITSDEISLDPAIEKSRIYLNADPKLERSFARLIQEKVGPEEETLPVSSEELTRLLATSRPSKELAGEVRMYREEVYRKGDFAEWMRLKGDGAVLVIKHLLASPKEVTGRRFELLLYDGNDRLIQKQPCTIQEIQIPKKLASKLGLTDHLFAVVATIRPNPEIRRYELATTRK